MSRIRFLVGLAAVLLVGATSLAQAQNYWVPQTGNWSVASNWSGTPGGNLIIDNGGTATVNSSIVLASSLSATFGDGGGNGSVTMTDGVLNVRTQYLGKPASVSTPTTGTFTQSGGVNIPYAGGTDFVYSQLSVGYLRGGTGAYNMSGGSVGAKCRLRGRIWHRHVHAIGRVHRLLRHRR